MPAAPILAVIGTRPEAIKLAPVIHALRARGAPVRVCLTGQHRELLAQGLAAFGLAVDQDLALMTENQTLPELTARIVAGMAEAIGRHRPAWVVVQGDTISAMAGGLAAFQCGVAVAHVEAGLRSFDLAHPWPEEMNRRLLGQLATLHFAPGQAARSNLLGEGIADAAIHVTGNTVVDALHWGLQRLQQVPSLVGAAGPVLAVVPDGVPLLLVTAHRRENLDRLPAIEAALCRLAARGDCRIVLPSHANPRVLAMTGRLQAAHANLLVVPALEYLPFLALLRRADLVLTDSGGLQEEAATLGKPVLVLRDATERPELQQGGNGMLVGTDTETIVEAAGRLLDDEPARRALSHPSTRFGDGQAAERIAELLWPQP